ncbi:stage II sporulation protein M [Paenibacillus senegalensis]|uniref:stage II sporulation protein M n=1 Tax=Paenibacillus senegalensis TaxID=1465766 RepID=UPI000287B245|nr:stage II sporulation protein M [Paenibacillus senegalensis]
MSFPALWKHFKEMKHYFIAATLAFFGGAFLGYTNEDAIGGFVGQQIGQLQGVIGSLTGDEASPWFLFFYILMNNTFLSIVIMYLGAFFALVPLYFLVSNGLLLGYLALENNSAGEWMFFAKAILPHGIIEIPAILIAGAYGIKFGFLMAEGALSFISARRRAIVQEKIITFLKLTIPLLAVIAGMLFVAAILENTLTPWLLSL